jgi:hypothetical protein
MNLEHQLVLDKVLQLRKASPCMGARKLHVMLTNFLLEHQIKMGRDALFDLLASHYLWSGEGEEKCKQRNPAIGTKGIQI